jgi:hypothetical protein
MVKARPVLVATGVLAVLVLSVYACAPFLASFDAQRVVQQRGPVFCWSHWTRHDAFFADGGSIRYEGFGYTLLRKHRLVDVHPVTFETGVKVSFTMPFYRRYDWETSATSLQ